MYLAYAENMLNVERVLGLGGLADAEHMLGLGQLWSIQVPKLSQSYRQLDLDQLVVQYVQVSLAYAVQMRRVYRRDSLDYMADMASQDDEVLQYDTVDLVFDPPLLTRIYYFD